MGGEEWNSPAYDPLTNLIFTPDVEWCTTVKLQTREEIAAAPLGQPWTGEKALNPFNEFGEFTRTDRVWAGWLYGTDADTGVWKWRLKSNYPIFGGVTPTAGGLVFFGDMGGNFYALDTTTGQKLWGQKIGGAIGGGVITYTVNGAKKSRWRPATYLPLFLPKSGERRSRSSASTSVRECSHVAPWRRCSRRPRGANFARSSLFSPSLPCCSVSLAAQAEETSSERAIWNRQINPRSIAWQSLTNRTSLSSGATTSAIGTSAATAWA